MISERKLKCSTCPIWHRKQAGDIAYFKAACTPLLCELREQQKLHFREFWRLCTRLMNWQYAELHGTVARALRQMPMELVDAFVEYRATWNRVWEKRRK